MLPEMEIEHVPKERLDKLRKVVRGDANMSPYRAGVANGFEWLYADITGHEPEYVKIPKKNEEPETDSSRDSSEGEKL